MYRSRSCTYVAGAVLIILTIYTFLSISSSPIPQALKSPGTTKPGPAEITTSPTPIHHTSPQDGPIEHEDKPPSSTTSPSPSHSLGSESSGSSTQSIDDLIQEADARFEEFRRKETHTLEDAAKAYRTRRGRHPPPGFDLWYKYAEENKAVMVEDFWDQIYHDLNPFWAIEPAMIRTQARKLGMGAELKDGKVVATADWFWHEIWGKMIDTVAKHLPDMFIAMNPMDESRLLVRWENMTALVTKANREKSMPSTEKVIRHVRGWEFQGSDSGYEAPAEEWNGFNPYNFARRACPPDSPARQVNGILSPEDILANRGRAQPKVDVTSYFDGSFVTNYTEASDFCSDASIGGLHGALMMPLTCQNSDVLMPMFGGSKFHVNNEILLPAPMYWNEEERFGGNEPDPMSWKQKQDRAFWRGTATGGRNKPFTWYMFHRHRFIAIANGTRYRHTDQKGHDVIFNELFQETAIKTLRPETQANLADWIQDAHDVGFTDLVCDENERDGHCWYTNDEFEIVKGTPFLEQYQYKFLPDIDGNSFSGRYRAFILSNSVPIKATIYREWHDSRLVAWKHFVPMNNRFSDYYRILEYFMGNVKRGIAGRDDQAEKIAVEGREWGEKVLRKVDMQIYTFRLLLEYGRLTDNDRLDIGWVDDLLGVGNAGKQTSGAAKAPEEPGA